MINMSRISVSAVGVLLIGLALAIHGRPHPGPNPQERGKGLPAPVDIGKMFIPSGWMGDGEKGKNYVQVVPVPAEEKPKPGASGGVCTRVSYKPGPVGWAGVYWQHPADNWGQVPGVSIRGATKLVFWAAGKKGGEIVEFKTGGISSRGKPYKDSFEASLGSVALNRDWKQYQIDLKGQDLSNVIGGFAWVATGDANPGGLVFYLADMRFE
jgi:hypothetical protein